MKPGPKKNAWMRRARKKNPERYRTIAAASYSRRNTKHAEQMAVLKNHPCTDCGGRFPPECMDWDHVRGVKKFNVGTMLGKISWASLLEEIAKCELVCANCHRTRTKTRRG